MLGWFKKKFKGKTEPEPSGAIPAEAPEQTVSGTEAPSAPPSAPPAAPPAAGVDMPSPPPVPETRLPESKSLSFPPEPSDAAEEKSPGFFRRLTERLSKTRDSLIKRVDRIFLGRRQIDQDLFDELEEVLITADLGIRITTDLLEHAKGEVKRSQLSDPMALRSVIKERLLGHLLTADKPAELVMPAEGPFVIMVLGVNGVGKTTTIGKLAYKFKAAGQKVLLVAADTFRAAAVEQLQIWAERIGVDIVAQKQGADPSSVIYDALDHARPRDFDVIIVDTAGRLHTKVNLMEELKKIKRVMAKKLPGSPHEILLVLDATTGQNALSQARLFHEAVDLTGITLTKLDGTAKGGIIVNICSEFRIPIRFIGIGEKMEDLRDFDPKEFVEALFAEEAA